MKVQGRRFLFFVNWLRRGAGMINREIAFAEELQRRGGEVMVLSHFRPELEVGEGIPVRVLVDRPFRHRWYDYPLTRWWVDGRARRVLDAFGPDVVFTDLPAEAERMLRLRGGRGFKLVYTYHGTADGSAYGAAEAEALAAQQRWSHEVLRQADLAVVVSDYLLPEAAAAGVAARRLYNGVDLVHWSPGGEPARPAEVLFVGRYTESKGTLALVQAFVQVARRVPGVVLQMHGYFERPEYEAAIRAEIEASGVGDRIRMAGPLDWGEMVAAIRRCTVFANASVDESFCMPFLEAEACGRCCLGFRSRGIPEVVVHGETGLLAEPGDVAGFAAMMEQLLLDDAMRGRFELAARAHAERFAYGRLADELEQLLEGL